MDFTIPIRDLPSKCRAASYRSRVMRVLGGKGLNCCYEAIDVFDRIVEMAAHPHSADACGIAHRDDDLLCL